MRRALAVAAASLVPGTAHACAVCGAGGDPNRGSFLGTTIFLSLLPLAMMAAGLLFLRHAARRRTGDAGAPEPASVHPHPSA